MDIYRNVYERLDALPTEERIALLMEILPPQELFTRTDGFPCLIRAFGLRIFETASMLSEAGIPDDDPRTEVFRILRGGLVDEKIPNKLRSIAARERTVCKRVGAIQVWDGRIYIVSPLVRITLSLMDVDRPDVMSPFLIETVEIEGRRKQCARALAR